MKIDVIIPSAGSGSRMGIEENKIFLPLSDGKSVLYHTLSAFCLLDYVSEIIIPCKEVDRDRIEQIASEFTSKKIVIVKGGATRTESVKNALGKTSSDYVLVHDCARPFVTKDLIDRVKEKMLEFGSAIPVLTPSDTVKKVEGDKVCATLDRDSLALVQTPQGFDTKKLKIAYDSLGEEKVTDDASVYEKLYEVCVVEGEKSNIKITTKEDLKKEQRVGVGFDAHRFEKGRDLYLGGVKIDSEYGLLGHSDADVLLHAIMDALLSSVHLRDIGVQFPCTPEYKDVSSVKLYQKVMDMLKDKGAKIVNISAVIVAEKPKLSPHIEKIAKNIATLSGISEQNVSLSATTTEKLGFTGREEGIASEAICLVEI